MRLSACAVIRPCARKGSSAGRGRQIRGRVATVLYCVATCCATGKVISGGGGEVDARAHQSSARKNARERAFSFGKEDEEIGVSLLAGNF